MLRAIFILLVALNFLYMTDAQAVVQSASQALSFNNVIRSSSAKERMMKQEMEKAANAKKINNVNVDLSKVFYTNINLSRGATITVTIPEEDCCSWKPVFDKYEFIFTDKGITRGVHTFVFKQDRNNVGDIYFDSVDKKTKSIKQTKAVYIKSK